MNNSCITTKITARPALRRGCLPELSSNNHKERMTTIIQVKTIQFWIFKKMKYFISLHNLLQMAVENFGRQMSYLPPPRRFAYCRRKWWKWAAWRRSAILIFVFHLMTPRSPSCVLSLAIIHRNDSLGPEDNLKFVEEHLAARQLKSFIVTDWSLNRSVTQQLLKQRPKPT